MRHRMTGVGRWMLWTLAAVLPLGCAALFVSRRRGRLDPYDEWWRRREHARANGNHRAAHERERNDDLFV